MDFNELQISLLAYNSKQLESSQVGGSGNRPRRFRKQMEGWTLTRFTDTIVKNCEDVGETRGVGHGGVQRRPRVPSHDWGDVGCQGVGAANVFSKVNWDFDERILQHRKTTNLSILRLSSYSPFQTRKYLHTRPRFKNGSLTIECIHARLVFHFLVVK